MSQFDLAIIGAGPGGFDAALRGRELGFKVALIDKGTVGGACLNTGCIPTKTLLASAKLLTKIQNAKSYGLSVSGVSWDGRALVLRKNQMVETLRKGMAGTLKKAGVELIQGEARFAEGGRLCIDCREGSRTAPPTEIEAKWILIATGAEPAPFPGVSFDGKQILSSTALLEETELPASLLIIGGGVVGVEFASLFQAFGTKVILVEMLERLLPTEDEEVSRRLESLFRRKGIEIHVGQKVAQVEKGKAGVEVVLESGEKVTAQKVLVAVGRKPCLEGLGLEKAGVKVERGAIWVDAYLETSRPGIFAIGDATTRTTGLAHGASAEGIRAVENLKGPRQPMDYRAIPNCIYTDPEIASVGAGFKSALTTEEIVQSKVLFSGIGKSHVDGETEGFIKMAASKKDGRILSFTGIGTHVTELVHEAALAIKMGLTAKDLSDLIHAHPTEGEILQKAARQLVFQR